MSCGSHIFNDTVRANFRLANAAVTDEAIWAALETVNLASFVRENGGLDKVIAEDTLGFIQRYVAKHFPNSEVLVM